jgi:hypothetical protein
MAAAVTSTKMMFPAKLATTSAAKFATTTVGDVIASDLDG